jgi:translation initiation factor IF-2
MVEEKVKEKEKGHRLSKVMKEFNLGNDTIVAFLKGKGHAASSDIATSKLTAEQYELLFQEYADDKKLKERAEQKKVKAAEVKATGKPEVKASDEQAPDILGPTLTADDLRSNLMSDAPAQEVVKAKAEPKAGLKVVGKVDLDAKPAPRAEPAKPAEPAAKPAPKTAAKAKAAPAPEAPSLFEAPAPAAEQTTPIAATTAEVVAPKVEAIAEEVATAAEPAEEEVIRARDSTPKLGGLKVMGKIELPGQGVPARGEESNEERQKRKRKGPASSTPDANRPGVTGAQSFTAGPAKPVKPGSRAPRSTRTPEPNQRDVQDSIRSTLAGLYQGRNRGRQRRSRDKRDVAAAKRDAANASRLADSNVLEVTEFLTANELSKLMDVSVNEVIAKCLELGMFVSINQRIDGDVIQLIAEEFGFEVRFISLEDSFEQDEEEEEDEADLVPRHPIVTVMGHVDHGKTSLLDFVRNTNVIAGEAGGITQHIGAYELVLKNGRRITFLDTPGHEAFTAMRARGAQVTDIAIIVIAADDQVMPQTREAINHAQAAGVPMVFAINKIDKEGAQADRIRTQLSEMNILVEDWGGKFQVQEISAKKGVGIDELLDKVLLEAELLDLKANPDRPGRGTVIEAQLDKGRGVVATVLVTAGTLKVGDLAVANQHWGRIKAMTDERGNRVKEAGPATPVQILGLDGVPQAGDKFQVMLEEREARELVSKRQQLVREQTIRMQKHITLDEIARRSALGDFQQLNIIVKGDVDGSVEALSDSLLKLSTPEVAVSIILKGVGQISESDVLLASASEAIIVGFQVRPSAPARKLAEVEAVEIRHYSIIYDAINEIKDALEGLLKPKVEEELAGTAEVRDVFKISKVGTVAGCMVTEGTFTRTNPVRLVRDGFVVYTGKLGALKRFKDDVREVKEGFECGMQIEGYQDIRPGDVIETFTTKEVKRTLASTMAQ